MGNQNPILKGSIAPGPIIMEDPTVLGKFGNPGDQNSSKSLIPV